MQIVNNKSSLSFFDQEATTCHDCNKVHSIYELVVIGSFDNPVAVLCRKCYDQGNAETYIRRIKRS